MTVLTIDRSGYDCPDDTYFVVADVQPEIFEQPDGTYLLKLMNGQGRRRSWGTPSVTSTVVLEAEDIVSIHIGFNTKHGGGQFWRHYTLDASQNLWYQVKWPQISDTDRQRILTAYEDHAPHWANVPGKTRDQYRYPSMVTQVTYKLVAVEDEKYLSVYALFGNSDQKDQKEREYSLGKRLMEKAVDNHGGGYYSYPDPEIVIALFHSRHLFPKSCYAYPMTLALLECEISGTLITYPNGKMASTYLRPLREVSRFDYVPSL